MVEVLAFEISPAKWRIGHTKALEKYLKTDVYIYNLSEKALVHYNL